MSILVVAGPDDARGFALAGARALEVHELEELVGKEGEVALVIVSAAVAAAAPRALRAFAERLVILPEEPDARAR